MFSVPVVERATECAAAAFMKCSPTVPFVPTWYGDHSEDGFQMISGLSPNSGGSTSRPMTVQSSLASGCGRMTGYSEIFQDAIWLVRTANQVGPSSSLAG